MIQAHKSLETASLACNEGGMIILFAYCEDGLGRTDFLKWFETGRSIELASMLCEKYQVNGQTAWSLLQKSERYDVRILTSLPDETVNKMGLKRISTDGINGMVSEHKKGYILTSASHIHIEVH